MDPVTAYSYFTCETGIIITRIDDKNNTFVVFGSSCEKSVSIKGSQS